MKTKINPFLLPLLDPLTLHLCLRGKSESGAISVKHNVLALEEDVAEDGLADALVGLNATEAVVRTVANRGVVDQAAGDNGGVAVDDCGEAGELRVAGEDVAASLGVVLGSLDLLVVGLDDIVGEEEEGGASVLWEHVRTSFLIYSLLGSQHTSNANNGLRAALGANGIAIGGELPEALGVVYVGVGERTSVLGLVDVAKVKGARGIVLQSHCEKRGIQILLDGVEPGGLGLRLDCEGNFTLI